MSEAAIPRVICLAGPTGAGKTRAALILADMLEGMGLRPWVINADSRQIYAGLPIITAQPNDVERAVCPHLLYEYLPLDEKSTAWGWADMAKRNIEQIAGQGGVVLLVGGTGMYMKVLLDGMADIPPIRAEVRKKVGEDLKRVGAEEMYTGLSRVDPDYAVKIHPRDRQRIGRAWEVFLSTGQAMTWWHQRNTPAPDWQVLHLGIGVPLSELEPLLRKRIEQMLEAGAADELRAALEIYGWERDLPGFSAIGCVELKEWLSGKIRRQDCLDLWAKNTRAYAKRQWTWFRADKRINWFRHEDALNMTNAVQMFLKINPLARTGMGS